MQQLRTHHDARLNSETAPTYQVVTQLLAPLGLTEDEILAKAREILARRLNRSDVSLFDSPQSVRDYLVAHYAELQHEVFGGVWLDSQHRVLQAEVLFTGTLSQTSVYPREVVKAALRHNAGSVVLFHNHPSGVGKPSDADETLTRELKKALALVDVRVLDHFIVAGTDAPVSFAERGLI